MSAVAATQSHAFPWNRQLVSSALTTSSLRTLSSASTYAGLSASLRPLLEFHDRAVRDLRLLAEERGKQLAGLPPAQPETTREDGQHRLQPLADASSGNTRRQLVPRPLAALWARQLMQQILRDVRDDARKIGELMPGRLASRRDVLRKLVPAVAAELGADGDANVHLVGRKRLPVVRLVPGLSPRLPARLLRLRARRRDDVRGRGTGGIRRVLLQASAEVAILRLKHGDSPLGGRKPRFQRGQTFLQRCTLPAASGPISHVHFIGTQAPRTKGGERLRAGWLRRRRRSRPR